MKRSSFIKKTGIALFTALSISKISRSKQRTIHKCWFVPERYRKNETTMKVTPPPYGAHVSLRKFTEPRMQGRNFIGIYYQNRRIGSIARIGEEIIGRMLDEGYHIMGRIIQRPLDLDPPLLAFDKRHPANVQYIEVMDIRN